jgi:hypothetical protein
MPAFQRRHYIAIAEMIAAMHADSLDMFETAMVNGFVDLLARRFKRDNPRFDADRFRAACAKVTP